MAKKIKLKIGNAVSVVDGITINECSLGPIQLEYKDLFQLWFNKQLVPEQQYRITDFVTTIKDRAVGAEFYHSAGHAFDLIVTAKNNAEFYPEAKAALHEGDEYFAHCRLDQWELRYEFCPFDYDPEQGTWAEIAEASEELFPYGVKGMTFSEGGNLVAIFNYEDEGGEEGHPTWMPEKFYWWAVDGGGYVMTKSKEPQIGDKVFSEDDLDLEEEPETAACGTVTSFGIIPYTKGRIIYMKDEFGNAACYDFKNIMCWGPNIISYSALSTKANLSARWYYLFDAEGTATTSVDATVRQASTAESWFNHEEPNIYTDFVFNNRILLEDNYIPKYRHQYYMDIGQITFADGGDTSQGQGKLKTLYCVNTIVKRPHTDSNSNMTRAAIIGTHRDLTIGSDAVNIVMTGINRVTSNNNKRGRITIGDGCDKILIDGNQYFFSDINIGNGSSTVSVYGKFNGRVNIGSFCKSITVVGTGTTSASPTSKTSSNNAVTINDCCQNIVLGNSSNTNLGIYGEVFIGNHCYDVNLPVSLYALTLNSWCTDIKVDGTNKFSLQNSTFGEHCTNIKFKALDDRSNGTIYLNIQIGNNCENFTFQQDNRGKGTCQHTSVQNIVIAPGFKSTCTIADARFEPTAGSTNSNRGETYFGQDAVGDYIMWWHSAGITVSGKKWNSGTSSWDAI